MSGKDSPKSDTGLNVRRTSSTDSTASVSTATPGRFTGTKQTDQSQDISIITSYGNNLYDTVCMIIYCPKHKKFLLSKISDQKGLFLPSLGVKYGIGWFESAHNCAKEALTTDSKQQNRKPYLSFSTPSLVHTLEVQIPVYMEFISRRVFYSELTFDPKYSTDCCTDSAKGKWHKLDDIRKSTELWGPEPAIFAEAVASSGLKKIESYTEYTVKDVLKFLPKDPPKSYQEEIMKAGGFGSEADVFKLFGDFMQQTFPSQYMLFTSFDQYTEKLGVQELAQGLTFDKVALFRSFSFNNMSHLSFVEVLLGLCALDKQTPHGGHTGELRCSYIYRYYTNNDMTTDDVRAMAKDLIQTRGSDGNTDLETEVKTIYKGVGVTDLKKPIDMKAFIKAIGEKRVRGTAALFRCAVSPIQRVRQNRVYESLMKTQIQANQANESKMKGVHGTCMRCRLKKYTLARHTVRLSKDGVIVDPQENKGQSDVEKIEKALKRKSDKVFLRSTFANQLLDNLREFALAAIPSLKGAAGILSDVKNGDNVWSNKQNKIKLAQKIMKEILPACEKIFKNESRLIHVSSPTFVLGDLHGNLHDLMIYENSLWKMGPTCVAANFLFLGDYVDRGEFGVEVILYLLCNKVLQPEKYWLLRGNHELRNVQIGFTFKTECLEKFGQSVGEEVWQKLNNVFDLMPICAIIDESIFCAHGGIPAHSHRVEELYKIPTPMQSPEEQSQLAWEILWNDPVTNQEFTSYQDMTKNSGVANTPAGFLANTKRGTAYYFSDEALTRFLQANRLSHVIRAHEVIPNGYQFHMGGRCITIFSSSRYCNGLNEAAVALVNDDKIRVIKIDTNW